MTGIRFLNALQSLGVELSAVGDRLMYRAPQGTITPALRREMVRHKKQMLALLQQPEATRPVPREGKRVPLSAAQDRLWFMDQLVPDSPLYNEAVAMRLSGQLNIAALKQSFEELARRHEALRTSFGVIGGQPYQLISPAARMDLPIFDLSELPYEARSLQANKIMREQAIKPFKLTEPPLIRTLLIRMGAREHILILSLHHIICDGWSKTILVRELSRLYNLRCRAESTALPDPTLQYSDFALYQKKRIASGELNAEMQYWAEQLGQSPPVMNLPADRARPPVPSYEGQSWFFALSDEVSEGVRRLSRLNAVTPFMTLLAVWQVLLARLCSQQELVVGTVVANRTRAELENTVGLMVNILAIKGDLSGNPTFKEMISRVKRAAIGAYKHQEIPYEKIVAELVTARSIRRNALVEVMFVTEEGLEGRVEFDGLSVSEEKINTGTAKYDLMMVMTSRRGRFEGRIEYNTDIFDEATIKRMAESFSQLTQAAIAEPEQRICDMPVLAESEREKILRQWNNTAVRYNESKNVHRMFEEQVENSPDRLAVIYEGAGLTYRELNKRANRLAHYLRKLGVGPDALVGLCLERSLEMAVAVLAVLKAGGAYLPLDFAYPDDRLRFMLEDAQPVALLTHKRLLNSLPRSAARVICPGSDLQRIEDCCDKNPVDMAGPENLAYVMYTSGSTGRPKGVSLPHRALTNLINWHNSTHLSKVRTLQFASLSFDVSFYEMFAAWASGGTLFIPHEELRSDIPRLADFISDNSIEKAILPVVVLQQLAEEHSFRNRKFMTLKEVITTGEQLQITRATVKFFNDFKACSAHNHYGPSESHVATSHALNSRPDSWPAHPPIGKPIANAQVYIFDQCLNPVPVGTIGELYISGVGLARGYLNRPDLTAERFIPNESGDSRGERLYKTGDLVRYLEDGSIEYLGRADHQVKIRGFRVELGEIESVLDQHPAVREAIVVAREDAPGRKRLLAYVATDRRQRVTADDLRIYLRDRLPDHMMPSGFIVLERLPLTPNGKIDRAALTSSYQTPAEEMMDLIPPRTPAEELVAKIWGDVLGVEKVGIESNFFHLGGHSLLASNIVLRLREIFRVELPVRSLFEMPTVAGIVKAMSEIRGGREIVEEIAWTYLQVEEASDEDIDKLLAQRTCGPGGSNRPCGKNKPEKQHTGFDLKPLLPILVFLCKAWRIVPLIAFMEGNHQLA